MGLVSAQDEVIALGDGVLAWPDLAHELLATPAVLVQPVEQGVAAGFERLDFNYASAGAMRFPGRLVERLGELPGDVETFACLQRIALQGGVPQRSVPDDVIAQGRWTLLHNEQEVQAVEPGWISHHLFEDGLRSPSEWLAGQAVRLAGPALLEAGSGGTVVAMAAGVLAALGMVAGGFGAITLGLMLVAAAWLGLPAHRCLAGLSGAHCACRGRAWRRLSPIAGLLTACCWPCWGWRMGKTAISPGCLPR
jgi:hypothetical protein